MKKEINQMKRKHALILDRSARENCVYDTRNEDAFKIN